MSGLTKFGPRHNKRLDVEQRFNVNINITREFQKIKFYDTLLSPI